MYHMVNWSQSPWNKASNPGHVPCWCDRRATTDLFCLRDDHPFKVPTPREASNLKPNRLEVLTSSTSLLHCIFQRWNGLSLTTRYSKVNEVFVLLRYGAMSLDNSYPKFQDSSVAFHLTGCINTVSKYQASVIQWCCTVFWKNEALICIPVKASNLTLRVYIFQGEKSIKVSLTKITYCLYMQPQVLFSTFSFTKTLSHQHMMWQHSGFVSSFSGTYCASKWLFGFVRRHNHTFRHGNAGNMYMSKRHWLSVATLFQGLLSLKLGH